MPRNKDVLWEYIVQNGMKVKCIFCHEIFVDKDEISFCNTCSKDINPCKAVSDFVSKIALEGIQELETKTKGSEPYFVSQVIVLLEPLFPLEMPKNVAIDTPQSSNLKQKPICLLTRKMDRKEVDEAKMDRNEVDKAIVKYTVNSILTFDLSRSSEFGDVCIAIANSGPAYEPPSIEHACTKLLTELKEEADMYMYVL